MTALSRALRRDDDAEDQGMHPDRRSTCHPCGSWADHAHDHITGALITTEEYERRKARRGSSW